MAEATDLRTALSWHLGSNHYPPVPQSMIDPSIEAIAAFVDEDPDRLIDLPEGVYYRDSTQAPARAIVEAHHLDAFIEVALGEEE
jgi:hypothetical protein